GQGDRLDLDQEVQDVAALAAAVAMEALDPVAPSEQGKRRRAIGMERAAGFVLAAVAAQLDVAADDVGEVGVRPDLVQVLIVSWHGSSLKVEARPGAAGDWNDAPSASHGSSGGGPACRPWPPRRPPRRARGTPRGRSPWPGSSRPGAAQRLALAAGGVGD